MRGIASGGRAGGTRRTRAARGVARAAALLVSGAIVASATTAAAQAPGLRATADGRRVRIGDPITVHVRAELPPGAAAVDREPHALDSLPDGVNIATVDSLALRGGVAEGAVRVVFLRTGKRAIPPLVVGFRRGGPMGAVDSLVGAPIAIEVTSVVPAQNTSIRDIKDIERTDGIAWWWGIVLLVAVGAAWLALARRRQARRRAAALARAAPVLPPPTPLAVALARLDEIERACRAGRGDPVQHAAAAADVLRAWIADELALPALERTTPELLDLLPALPDGDALVDPAEELLEEADLVKFARVRPRAADVVRWIARARALLESRAAEPVAAGVGGVDALR